MNKLVFLITAQFIFFSCFGQNILVSRDSTNFPAVEMDEVEIVSSKESKNNKIIQLPASVSLIQATKIKSEEIRSMTGLSGMIPNLFMPDYGTRLTSPVYLRGIGSRINSPSVGLYVDNVPYFEKAAFDFEFFDIEKIEVLRGPQGTLYGRNTMGGIVNIFTRNPAPVRQTQLELSGAGYAYYKGMLSHSQPLGEKASLRLNASGFSYGGFFKNHFNGEMSDAMKSGSGRIKLMYNPSRRVKTRLSVNLEKSYQEGYPYALYNSDLQKAENINYEHPSSYSRWLFSNNFHIKYLGDNFSLNATTSYQYLDGLQDIDQDFTPLQALVVQQDQLQHMMSQEISVNSTRPSDYSYVSGIFAFHQIFDSRVDVFYEKDAPLFRIPDSTALFKTYENSTSGLALFHQSSYNNFLLNGLSISGGIRLDYEKAEQIYNYTMESAGKEMTLYDDSPAGVSFFEVLPKFSLKYSRSELFTSYFTLSRGYKTGGFNTTFERDEDRSFDPETSINYELGFKSQFPGNSFYASLALFYIDWKNQQIYQTVPSGRGSMIKNAGESHSTGLELEMNARLIKRLNSFFSLGYTDARFDRYRKNESTDYSGNFIPYAPKMTLYTGLNYHIPLSGKILERMFMQISYNGFGKHFWHEDNTDFQEYYGLMNARLSLESKRIEFSIWGKNLLNEDYNSFYFNAIGNAYVQKGRPRLIGSTLSVRF